MIYIVGINHKYQNNPLIPNEIEQFKQRLKKLVGMYKISFIGEEYASYKTNSFPISHVKDFAEKNGLEHRYCDMDEETRKEYGIPTREEIKQRLNIKRPVFLGSSEDQRLDKESRKYDPVRENYWLQQIKLEGKIMENILFICGSVHNESFSKLLKNNGFRVVVLDNFD